MKTKSFLKLAASVLRRLDHLLPPEQEKPDWRGSTAFRWQQYGNSGILTALPRPHTFPLSRLAAVGSQTERLIRNTERFLSAPPSIR